MPALSRYQIEKENCNFITSVYRKSSFTGKGTNYFSFMYEGYKTAAITTLLNRAYEVSSTPSLFQNETCFLRKFFADNNYPVKMFNKALNAFLSNRLDFKRRVVMEHYPHVDPTFYFRCTNRIRSFFPLKDSTPVMMSSGVIYKYTCDCSQCYIGSTAVNFYIRISQHRGVSFRTGNVLSKPPKSSIREHVSKCGCSINMNNFSVIDKEAEASSLRILESLHIKRMRPKINECGSAVPTFIG